MNLSLVGRPPLRIARSSCIAVRGHGHPEGLSHVHDILAASRKRTDPLAAAGLSRLSWPVAPSNSNTAHGGVGGWLAPRGGPTRREIGASVLLAPPGFSGALIARGVARFSGVAESATRGQSEAEGQAKAVRRFRSAGPDRPLPMSLHLAPAAPGQRRQSSARGNPGIVSVYNLPRRIYFWRNNNEPSAMWVSR